MMGGKPALSFSHLGIWVTDLETMKDFYTDVLGFVMTDRGPIGDTELVFLSQSPSDHHQIVLAKGRPVDVSFTTVNQISFKLDCLASLKAMHADLVHRSVKELVQISHGNAWSCYFRDPEGNRVEVFVDTPWYTPQPCREPLDLTRPVEEIERATEAFCRSRPRFQTDVEWRRDLSNALARARAGA